MCRSMPFVNRKFIGSLAVALFGWLFAVEASAHDIPADVRINMFLRPSGMTLELLVRVPMSGMREVDFPTRGPGYLDLAKADGAIRNAAKLWLVDALEIYEDEARLPPPRIAAARVSLPSDRSFASYEDAKAHMAEPPLADALDLYWNQQLLDVALEYPIRSDQSRFSLRARVDRIALRVSVALRFLTPGHAERAFEFHGDPGLIRLDPRWHQAAVSFVTSGFQHILSGIDHLLFLLCLVIPFRRWRPLVVIVTAFTLAHAVSLTAAVAGFVPDGLWFPPLVETGIAISVFYMALENIVRPDLQRRWLVAFAFGRVHGFAFSFALSEQLQFAGRHLVTSLLSFNIGVELGQLAALLVLLPALALLFRSGIDERLGIVIVSVLVAHTAWHWLADRGAELMKFPMPPLDAALLAGLMRAAMAAIVLSGLLWLASAYVRRWIGDPGR